MQVPGVKKDPSVRQRRNKAATAATLTRQDKPDIPELPPHPSSEWGWHAQAVEFWDDVWSSPMSSEWDPSSDRHNVLLCALLVHDMWTADSPAARRGAAAELRLQRQDLGLAPYPRRRLEWTFEQADEAKERGAKRRSARAPASGGEKPGAKKKVDPRAHLHSVS